MSWEGGDGNIIEMGTNKRSFHLKKDSKDRKTVEGGADLQSGGDGQSAEISLFPFMWWYLDGRKHAEKGYQKIVLF